MRPASPSPALLIVPLACIALLLAPPAAAQTVEGVVLEAGSRAPVPRAMVSLLDAAGRAVAGTQTRADGRFTLTAPAAGTYRVRAERVGRATATSPGVALEAGRTAAVELLAAEAPVRLDALVVGAGERACSVRPDREARVAAVWEEARKALQAAEWSRRNEPRLFTVRAFSRERDPTTLIIRRESERSMRVRHVSPYRSVAAERLAEGGYVQRTGKENVFHAPDAEVLLSDAFLDTHCFRLERGDGLVGLAFEPVRGRRLPDVSGVLWLDAASAELRHVDYAYTGIAIPGPELEWGGRIEFSRLPDGAWYVRRWQIRMPIVGTVRTDGGSLHRDQPRALTAVKEDGAEVETVAEGGGGALASLAPPSGEWVTVAMAESAVPESPVAEGAVAESPVVESAAADAGTAAARPVAAAAERPGEAIALRPLEAVGEVARRRLEANGFYDRRRLGFGKFVDHEEFTRLSGARLLDRIMAMGGIYVQPHTSDAFSLYRPYRGGRCYYALFVDGMQASNQVINRLTVDEVEAIELYRGHELPGRFNPYFSKDWSCGALVIWTKASSQD